MGVGVLNGRREGEGRAGARVEVDRPAEGGRKDEGDGRGGGGIEAERDGEGRKGAGELVLDREQVGKLTDKQS